MHSFRHIFLCFVVLCFVTQTLIPFPAVDCRGKEMSKLEMLKLALEISKLPTRLIQKVREKPIIQLMGLANDLVEPFVTAAELVLLMEELKKKMTKENQKIILPYELPPEPQMVVPENDNMPFPPMPNEHNPYPAPKMKDPYTPYDAMMASASTAASKPPPMMLSPPRPYHHAEDGIGEYDNFKKGYLKESPEFEFHVLHEMPKNLKVIPVYPLRIPVRKVKKLKQRKYRRKH